MGKEQAQKLVVMFVEQVVDSEAQSQDKVDTEKVGRWYPGS